MRLGVRKTVALETQDEVEAAQKALALIDTPELGLAGTFKGEIEAFIKWKVDRNEYRTMIEAP